MTEEMQQFVIDVAIRAIEKFSLERDIAAYIKKECDKQFGYIFEYFDFMGIIF